MIHGWNPANCRDCGELHSGSRKRCPMAAALWTLEGEWRKSGSGLLKIFAAPLRQ